MHRYFFVLCGPNDEIHDDVHGTDFPDKSDALVYAKRIIGELNDAGGYDAPGWVLVIEDEDGEEVATLPVSDTHRRN